MAHSGPRAFSALLTARRVRASAPPPLGSRPDERPGLPSERQRDRSAVLALCLCLVVASSVGCAGGMPPAPAAVHGPVSAPGPPAAERLRYVLQRGDELQIHVVNRPELDATTLVRPDGKISVFVLDDVTAAGLTADALGAEQAAGWSEHFPDPRVTVVVAEFGSYNVYVGGEVEKPGIVPLRSRLSSVKAVIFAGGFKDTAQLDNLIVLRNVGGKPEVFSLDARKVLEGKQGDLRLMPYDVVYAPMSTIARVNLWVEQYITLMVPVQLQGAFNYTYISGNM